MIRVIYILVVAIPTVIVTWYTIFGMLDVNIGEFLKQSVGGGVGTYRAFLAAVGFLLFAGLTYIGKHSITGETSKLKSRVYFFSSIIGFVAFAILGSEFNAPKFTFAPFVDVKPEYTFGRVVEQSGIEFKLNSCSRSGTKISCDVDLYNLGDDMYFKDGHKSYLVDSDNNKANVTNFQSGKQSYGTLYSGSIPVPVDTKATMTLSFETPKNSSASTIRAIYLKIHFDNKYREIIFRNVSI